MTYYSQIPAGYPNWQAGFAPYPGVPTPPQGYTTDPSKSNSQLYYGPAPFNVNGQLLNRNMYVTGGLDGELIKFPGQPPQVADIPFFDGYQAWNPRVGSPNVTALINSINRTGQYIDATVAFDLGLSPVDPFVAFAFPNPTTGNLDVNNGRVPTQPSFPPAPAGPSAPTG